MRVTILGCGGSDGVPQIGGPDGRGDWGACDPGNPKNRRTRASVHVAVDDLSLLVDAAPDLRDQLMANGIGTVSHVLFTHDHADHSHGFNELRRLARFNGRPMDVYADEHTMKRLQQRFGYAFEQLPGSPYPAIAAGRVIDGPFRLAGREIVPVVQNHGFGETTLSFRIGGFAYSTDLIELPEEASTVLSDLDLWIVDCFRYEPHVTHAHWDKTMSWIERLRPRRAVLTHMGTEMDYEVVRRQCPPGVEPGYDGLVIDV
jgi:phosphoribosyl 1,2-cyclic phosphate phosphodiesterase